jgi:small conductance mechanosensitive channel
MTKLCFLAALAADTDGLMAHWVDLSRDWLTLHGPELVLKALGFLVILLVFRYLARFLGHVASKAVAASLLNVTDLLRNFFVNVVTKGTSLVGLMIALSFVGVEIGPLLAGVGVLGVVIGFALKDTLNNFACGIMILLYRPYDLEDYITAGGVSGTVKSMSLVSTTLVTGDNQVLVVPNGSIWGGVISNPNAKDTRRVDLTIGISYRDDIDKVQEVLEEIVASHPLVLEDPSPTIKLTALGESCVDFVVRPWTRTSDRWSVLCDLTKSIKVRFDQEGISIPYPQREIHVVSGEVA